ncbi:hypothetical protein JHD50_01970 [Sulfurimonas sp. MAG313]|nr:hypothetical protein [Sulfurimonas sp. MAG313]MDF1880077.1 hypothetical protein [Sulfurimonas sp. MAG313]
MSSKSQAYIQDLFSDKLLFEKEILGVHCDADRKDIMALMCKEICNDEKYAPKMNFLKIKSIYALDFTGLSIALVELLVVELLCVLKEKRYSSVEIETIKKNKGHLKFIYELIQTYMRRYSGIFYQEVVNTFFDLLSVSDRADKLSPLVLEIINGNEHHKSLLEQHGQGQILYKPEQAWMRVKQAKEDKNRQVQIYQVEIVRIVRRVDTLKLQISAIVAARALNASKVKKVTPKLLLDMFTQDDDIQLHTKKTMFSYIAGGDLANILVQTAKNARSESKDPYEKEDYRRIAEFFNKCKTLNTKTYVDTRFDESKHELELKSKRYREQRLKLKELRERSLDKFDVTLKKVKETMVYNLQHL